MGLGRCEGNGVGRRPVVEVGVVSGLGWAGGWGVVLVLGLSLSLSCWPLPSA